MVCLSTTLAAHRFTYLLHYLLTVQSFHRFIYLALYSPIVLPTHHLIYLPLHLSTALYTHHFTHPPLLVYKPVAPLNLSLLEVFATFNCVIPCSMSRLCLTSHI